MRPALSRRTPNRRDRTSAYNTACIAMSNAVIDLRLHLRFEFIYGWHGNSCGCKLVRLVGHCSRGLEKDKCEPYEMGVVPRAV